MEKTTLDLILAAFVDYHRSIGLMVMLFLILWYMSGRRLDPWAYTTSFVRTVGFLIKKLLKACEVAARETAAAVPTSHARWRPSVRVISHFCYCLIWVLTVIILVSQCAQTRL
jgi:hypothetical protein